MAGNRNLFFRSAQLPFVEARYTVASGRGFKPHLHMGFSVGAVVEGVVCYQVGDTTHILQPGSLALINPEILHSCNPETSQKRSFYMLHLDTTWCLQVQQSLWHVAGFCPTTASIVTNRVLYRQFCRVMEILFDVYVHLQEKEQLLVEFVSDLFLQSCGAHPAVIAVETEVAHLKNILQSDLQRDFTLAMLAEELLENPYTLLRRFKKQTGVTPHAYRMSCRVEQARRLLQDGMDITEAALQCGFFDQSHLHRQFRAMTTVTPKEYRVNFVQSFQS